MGNAKPVPEGYGTVSAYLVVPDAARAIELYAAAFGAEEMYRMPGPSGTGVMHAEIRIGDSAVMLADENPQWGATSALTLGGSPISLHLYVEDADALYERAVAAGCEATMPVMDAFWGDRYGKVTDPFGISWGIATHKEDLSPEEVAARAQRWFTSQVQG